MRVYDVETRGCAVLYGHSDIVLSVSTAGAYLLSGAKDNTAKLWQVSEGVWECVNTFKGHTGAVSAVCMSHSASFFLTGSHDRTIKRWSIETGDLSSYTFQAHDKDIQCIDIAPNDTCFVSGSLDKTAKVCQ